MEIAHSVFRWSSADYDASIGLLHIQEVKTALTEWRFRMLESPPSSPGAVCLVTGTAVRAGASGIVSAVAEQTTFTNSSFTS